MKKSYVEQVIENITGFDKWMTAWGLWHQGKGGKPNCKRCLGVGTIQVDNGPDDFDVEICECVKTLIQK